MKIYNFLLHQVSCMLKGYKQENSTVFKFETVLMLKNAVTRRQNKCNFYEVKKSFEITVFRSYRIYSRAGLWNDVHGMNQEASY
jgi:hypothetical protein